jgi:hypothetical protein
VHRGRGELTDDQSKFQFPLNQDNATKGLRDLEVAPEELDVPGEKSVDPKSRKLVVKRGN